jgi:hypothetical protein
MTTANVVYSGPADGVKPIYEEAIVASGQTILPGNLVTLSSGQWINHATAGQGGNIRIADMDTIRQKLVTDALTVGDTAGAFVPVPGQTYNLRLATSQVVAKGTPLTSTGAGTVRIAATDGTETVLFTADEAVTTTGAVLRIRARVAASGFSADTTA